MSSIPGVFVDNLENIININNIYSIYLVIGLDLT